MNPTFITYELGNNVFKQPITLTYSKQTGGGMHWTLSRGQADQRDDSSFVAGLTDDIILKMADAVKARRASL